MLFSLFINTLESEIKELSSMLQGLINSQKPKLKT
jgi:hypothetical protein